MPTLHFTILPLFKPQSRSMRRSSYHQANPNLMAKFIKSAEDPKLGQAIAVKRTQCQAGCQPNDKVLQAMTDWVNTYWLRRFNSSKSRRFHHIVKGSNRRDKKELMRRISKRWGLEMGIYGSPKSLSPRHQGSWQTRRRTQFFIKSS